MSVTAPNAPYVWISIFLEAQAAETGAATNTQLAYGRDLKDFAGWLERRQLDYSSVDREGVEAYLIDCDARGFSVATRAWRLSSIKGLFRFAFEDGMRTDDPAIQIKGPGRSKRLPTLKRAVKKSTA